MRAVVLRTAGGASVLLGIIGTALPLLPSVPFMILAAYCFGKSSPALERRLLMHPVVGPHIHRWRDRRQISRSAKRAAYTAFTISGSAGLLLLDGAAASFPLLAAIGGGLWIWRRPEPSLPGLDPTGRQ